MIEQDVRRIHLLPSSFRGNAPNVFFEKGGARIVGRVESSITSGTSGEQFWYETVIVYVTCTLLKLSIKGDLGKYLCLLRTLQYNTVLRVKPKYYLLP